jgi:hypothetical protein
MTTVDWIVIVVGIVLFVALDLKFMARDFDRRFGSVFNRKRLDPLDRARNAKIYLLKHHRRGGR